MSDTEDKAWREAFLKENGYAPTYVRCECIGSEWYCTHEGQCEEEIAPAYSTHYCDRCHLNALAEHDRG